jgi:restriction system protein
MGRRGFISTLNALARESARRQRQAEAASKRQARGHAQFLREVEKEKRIKTKEDKQQYLERRIEETGEKNVELSELLDELKGILNHTLSLNDTIQFDSLRIKEQYSSDPVPNELSTPQQPPDQRAFISQVKAPTFLEKALGGKRYERELAEAEARYLTAIRDYEDAESERKTRHAAFLANQDKACLAYTEKARNRNQEVDELEASYRSGDSSAIITYYSMVLERSDYPEGFPQEFRIAYTPESRQLVIDYELPTTEIIPKEVEYKYQKSKDIIESKPRKVSDIKDLYQDVVAAVALRTIHEVLEADQAKHIDIVVFNGFVHAIEPSTGQGVHPCLISVRTISDTFRNINLGRVDKKICLRNLGAQVSAQPQALQPVKPIVEFNMVDRRFIDQSDIISELDSRPNLMDLTPSEFENLVSNLFSKMGLETKLTRTSKDGGVDAVAFDTRPILGGKVVIQAKRYKNTVGVSAVRDLYGTMLNEGASKGILVTTSGYGPDAFEFSKDKPIELIEGGGLLYLLDQVGTKARIIMPEE